MPKTEVFKSIRIKLASPEDVHSWSHGEVTKPETINYRTQRPEKDGLFCERIFGPTKDYECYCGKYKRIRFKGVVCDRCGVEVTKSSVRRERMGHIKLQTPVVHIWFFRKIPSRIALLLNVSQAQIERVIYFMAYIITNIDEDAKKKALDDLDKEYKFRLKKIKEKSQKDNLKNEYFNVKNEINSIKKYRVLSEVEYQRLILRYNFFQVGMGAEAVRQLLGEIDLNKLEKDLNGELEKNSSEDKNNVQKRLQLVKSLIRSNTKPEWMCFMVIPVLPPDLRPMVQLDGGRYASSDLNDLYRRVINRNNRLKYLIEIGAPEVIQRNEKRMLQEAVDALFDNSARRTQVTTRQGGARRELKSLTDMLRGKTGRFRQNLLGKRVDYSARSVIVVGPNLKLEEVGIPKKLALEITKPFIINKILERNLAHNVRAASRIISEGEEEVWEILEEVIKDKFLLLNRAPTLHRLSIQAFKPKLIEGEAIQVHPLVCPAFNADFDGDQMAVHLPFSKMAQWEAKNLMISTRGILLPSTGKPVALPRQDMIMGCYFLTDEKEDGLGKNKFFYSPEDALLAYENKLVDLQVLIKVANIKGYKGIIETTIGRIIFNQCLPDDFPLQNERFNNKKISSLISEIIQKYGRDLAVSILDRIKEVGFRFATISATTWGLDELSIPEEKREVIEKAKKEEGEILNNYKSGFLSEEEKRESIILIWQKVKDEIAKLVPLHLKDKHSSVFLIVDSGSRGSWAQPLQMAGLKGLVMNPAGDIIELPVVKSYQEGLSSLEYFISTHGARKGTTDTALRTSKAGYLTRRLVDVAHGLIIKKKSCQDKDGLEIDMREFKETGQEISSKIYGKILAKDLKVGNKIIAKEGSLINWDIIYEVEKVKDDIGSIHVFSPLTCKLREGICQKCYGMDLGYGMLAEIGTPVGIIAAQSIGEPGTQLTMRTFHTGGVAGVGDITSGLPRVDEIFELRVPKGEGEIFQEDGIVKSIKQKDNVIEIAVKTEKNKKTYTVPSTIELLVKEGDRVGVGDLIYEGSIDLKKLFKVAGKIKTQKYILNEIQKIYAGEGVSINDKHIEIIVRQMFSMAKVIDIGDSIFSPGEIVTKRLFHEENKKLRQQNKKEAKSKNIILGITKISLSTDSFLSAASFQETSNVLIRAAIEGREDELRGLKENVIIGKLVPAGMGYKK